MVKILNERGYSFTTDSDWDLIQELIQNLAHASFDYRQEMEQAALVSKKKFYQLPDGQMISVGNERFQRLCFTLRYPGLNPLSSTRLYGIR